MSGFILVNSYFKTLIGLLKKTYEPKFKYKHGDEFPFEEFRNQDGKTLKLKSLEENWVVLFFYPQDLTPTCTKQACNLRDAYADFSNKGIRIFGISPDSEKSHLKFIRKHQLPFDLIIDTEHSMAKQLGVFGKKKFMGRVYDGIHRTTLVLNNKRHIHSIIYPVESGRHNEQILEAISQTD